MYKPTQRTYTDVETQEEYTLYMDDITHEYQLISEGSKNVAEGTEVNGFYAATHGRMDIKLNTGKVVKLDRREFYNLKLTENGIVESVTHIRYWGFTKFRKV